MRRLIRRRAITANALVPYRRQRRWRVFAATALLLVPAQVLGGRTLAPNSIDFLNGYPLRFSLPEAMPSGPSPIWSPEIAPRPEMRAAAKTEPGGEADDSALSASFTRPAPAEQPAAAPQLVETRRAALAPGMLAIRYDLAAAQAAEGVSDGEGGIVVVKPVALAGKAVGKARIRLGAGSRIYISRSDLAQVLQAQGLPAETRHLKLAEGPDYLSFDTVRDGGFGLAYDAVSDRLVISPRS